MKWVPIGISLAMLVLLSAGTQDSSQTNLQPEDEVRGLVDGNTDFAGDVFRNLKASDANLAFSPHSLSSVLAVVQAGAKGQTDSQITSVCHFPTNQAERTSALAIVRSELATAGKSRGVQLVSATGLWAQKYYSFDVNFLDFIRKQHGTEIRMVDYAASPDAAFRSINDWVKKQTKGKIPDGISRESVTPATRLIVANAIYFKGQWAKRFDPGATRKRPFQGTAESAMDVQMMQQENVFPYGENEDMQVLVLPYVGKSLQMIVLLPKQGGLGELEQRLSAKYLKSWIHKIRLYTVDVWLPRFKITSSYPLNEPLKSLGLQDAFNPTTADFSGMSTRRPLYIQTVAQSTFVEVDEEGTKAASATHTGLGCSIPTTPPHAQFHADRPFIFLIRDKLTGTILFMGRVTNPGS
jgi:serpin B